MIRSFEVVMAFDDEAGKDYLMEHIADEIARMIKDSQIHGEYKTYEIYDVEVREAQ